MEFPNDSTRTGDDFPSGFCFYEVNMFSLSSLVSQFAFMCQLKFNRDAGRLKHFTVTEKVALFILGWSHPLRRSASVPVFHPCSRSEARLEPGCGSSPSLPPSSLWGLAEYLECSPFGFQRILWRFSAKERLLFLIWGGGMNEGGETSSYIFHPTSMPRLKSTGPSQSTEVQMEAGVTAQGATDFQQFLVLLTVYRNSFFGNLFFNLPSLVQLWLPMEKSHPNAN